MKLQLSQTAEKDVDKGMGAGWERFQFNKDAPLDDEEIEVAEDDAAVVKKMGQSFRFSAIQAKREEQIKDAHDQAMFGVPIAQPCISTDTEVIIEGDKTDDHDDRKGTSENGLGANLISDKVLTKQQGSWRDQARKLNG
ncbi:serine/arginine-rich splicing factor [Thalictrum thalictroides]|uniref:Serine/arginine-rich splicing factor n=1 Tax=Thalictrum thalictroides TaxID=46969 RepID=A0A7J6VVA7_THATH|nr:serine/arginine-rich splicing factor [Thalictrum thalictroides]